MLNLGDLAYVHYKDLKYTLPVLKDLPYGRFGYITNIQKITTNDDSDDIYEYTIKTLSNKTFKINGLNDLQVCSIQELRQVIDEIKNEITDEEYNALIAIVNLHCMSIETQK